MARRDRWGTIVLFSREGVTRWPLLGEGTPDMDAVDSLARLRLDARRCGFDLRLEIERPELTALLELTGLREVLG